MILPEFATVHGVDFSGAKKAGENTWVATLEPLARRRPPQYVLTALHRLESLAGTADRSPALRFLVDHVRASDAALWGFDFPFGLPIELFPVGTRWADQFALLTEWGEDAYGCGLECVRRTRHSHGKLHIRRATDADAKAPFDCYHYRIIYQTFYGMRDVIAPLARSRGTAVLPFHYRRLSTARRVLVESCPASTLKKLGWPHQNYKQPAGGPLIYKRLRTKRVLLDALSRCVRIDDRHRRVIMRNPGGDALDAVIAAIGAARAVAAADHCAIARHPRYPHEGHLYV
jgi:hypothetical protein